MSDILQVRELRAYYGQVQALHGIDLSLREGSVTTLLGSGVIGNFKALARTAHTWSPCARRHAYNFDVGSNPGDMGCLLVSFRQPRYQRQSLQYQ